MSTKPQGFDSAAWEKCYQQALQEIYESGEEPVDEHAADYLADEIYKRGMRNQWGRL